MAGHIALWAIERRRELVLSLAAFLIASLSFALGYVANREFAHQPLVIETCVSSTAMQ